MFKSKFVFAVSFVALFAVGSAWAADSDAGIAGVSYVDRLLSDKFANTSTVKKAIVTTDSNGNVAPVVISDAGTGTYITGVTVSDSGAVELSRGTPTAVNNATLTIQKNGVDVGTFTANSSSNKTINITVPTGSLASKNTIANADVADNAAIAQSKIANLTTDLAAKEVVVNKLKSTDATVISDSNKDTLYPTYAKTAAMIDADINALDKSDAAVSGQYVSSVSETDGVISVTRGNLPTVNNATLTIQKNGADVGTFTANSSSNKTINITVPTGSLASKNTIANADVADNAAIAQSKIANLTTDLAAKQDKLVPDTNIKGAGSVTVFKGTDGVITISGTDTKYTLPDATTAAKGGVIVGTNISVSNGTISVADATASAKGVGKLYAGTGDYTDGSMTQKAITSALNGKVDKNQGTENVGKGLVVDAQGALGLVDVATQTELDDAVLGLEGQIEGISGGVATELSQFKTLIDADIAAKVSIDQTDENADKAVITNNTGKITTGQIVTGMIANTAVTTDKIAATAVTTAKIDAGAVTTAKIDAGAVTVAKTTGIYGYIPTKSDGTGSAQIWVE